MPYVEEQWKKKKKITNHYNINILNHNYRATAHKVETGQSMKTNRPVEHYFQA
jgi:hypothetical protein